MRRYLIREKWLALGDDFTITDDRGRDAFFVDGKAITIRDALVMRDMQGQTVASIRKRLLAWGPTYEIERNGRTTNIRKHLFTIFKARFTIDVPGPDDIEAVGDLLHHEYQFIREDGRPVASVSKKWLSLTDAYAVQITDDADDALILASAIVIDRVSHERD